MSKRSAPRRKVLEVQPSGKHGSRVYKHFLQCGHVEIRKRQAPATYIGCEACDFNGYDVGDEVALEFLKLKLASRFGLNPYDVILHTDAQKGRLIIKSASLHLSARDVKRLAVSRAPKRRKFLS